MSNSILKGFHRPFLAYTNALNKGRKAYLYANDAKQCLEVGSSKEMPLWEVFQKAQNYLQVPIAHTNRKAQVTDLGEILKDGEKLIAHYHKKNHTGCRRFLKLICDYIPRILKNIFPCLHKMEKMEQKTQAAYQSYVKAIEQLQKKLNHAKMHDLQQVKKIEGRLIPQQAKKDINDLPDAILQDIAKNGLCTKEREIFLRVCLRWNAQLKKSTAPDRLASR